MLPVLPDLNARIIFDTRVKIASSTNAIFKSYFIFLLSLKLTIPITLQLFQKTSFFKIKLQSNWGFRVVLKIEKTCLNGKIFLDPSEAKHSIVSRVQHRVGGMRGESKIWKHDAGCGMRDAGWQECLLTTRCGDKNTSFGAGFSHLKLTVGGIRDENIPRDGGIKPKFESEFGIKSYVRPSQLSLVILT